MNITIIHPSRSRPEQAARTAKKWLSSAQNQSMNNIQYIFSLDESDETLPEYKSFIQNMPPIAVVHDNSCAVQAINNAAEYATGDLLIVISDDFSLPPFHWDVALVEALHDKQDFIVKTSDFTTNRQGQQQGQPWIITLPIMDRKYYERFGYIYYPAYGHMFCDTEMTHVADLLGRKITLPINFPHNHYSANGVADEVSNKANATWAQGEALYLSRVKDNFGLVGELCQPQFDLGHQQWLKSKGINL